jgi:hypothetical protein
MRRLNIVGRAGAAAISTAALALSMLGCDDNVTNTDLEPGGPPRVLQVFARERSVEINDEGHEEVVLLPRIAYGEHADIGDEDDRTVDAAVVGTDQKIRLVIDELLRGNFLEEIACADGETWSQVPVGTTPDDVARCTGADLSRCTAVCQGPSGPIGVLDANGDRSLDDTRLIAGVITLTCGGVAVPVDQQASFWQPSGNQFIPAGDHGIETLGPAVVIVPAQALPTSSECAVALAESVVDKSGVRPCAPAGGPAAECAPGDLGGIHFTTEPLLVLTTSPANGEVDVALTESGAADAHVTVHLNGFVDGATAAATAFTLAAGETPVAGVTVALDDEDPTAAVLTVPGVAAGDGGLKDTYGASLGEASTITWTTKAAALAGAGTRR